MIDNLISNQMKEIWINLELYFEICEFSNFKGFFQIFFWIFNKLFQDFLELQIDFLI